MALPAVQQKAHTIRNFLSQGSVKKQLGLAVPKHLTVDRLLRVAMTSIQKNRMLLDCTPESLLACVITCAQLGLEPDQVMGQAYLVPFRNRGTLESQLIVGYRGLLSLIRRSGDLQSVQCQVVYENDLFNLQYGLNERLDHIPADGDRGNPRGAYVVLRYRDGGHSYDYMPANDIERIRRRSKSPDSGPWVTDWDEMAKKTVIRRHAKLAPVSIEVHRALALEDRFNAGESQMDIMYQEGATEQNPEPIDVKVTEGEVVQMDDEAVRKFDRLTTEKGLGGNADFAKFLQVTADANGATLSELKAKAAARFEDFHAAYQNWLAKLAKNRKEQPKQSKTAKAPPSEPVRDILDEGEAPNAEPLIACPVNQGDSYRLSYCQERCELKDQCSALKEATQNK